jgi:2-keto-3-deoxy-L-rhamnonate aldolase RhmA
MQAGFTFVALGSDASVLANATAQIAKTARVHIAKIQQNQ